METRLAFLVFSLLLMIIVNLNPLQFFSSTFEVYNAIIATTITCIAWKNLILFVHERDEVALWWVEASLIPKYFPCCGFWCILVYYQHWRMRFGNELSRLCHMGLIHDSLVPRLLPSGMRTLKCIFSFRRVWERGYNFCDGVSGETRIRQVSQVPHLQGTLVVRGKFSSVRGITIQPRGFRNS